MHRAITAIPLWRLRVALVSHWWISLQSSGHICNLSAARPANTSATSLAMAQATVRPASKCFSSACDLTFITWKVPLRAASVVLPLSQSSLALEFFASESFWNWLMTLALSMPTIKSPSGPTSSKRLTSPATSPLATVCSNWTPPMRAATSSTTSQSSSALSNLMAAADQPTLARRGSKPKCPPPPSVASFMHASSLAFRNRPRSPCDHKWRHMPVPDNSLVVRASGTIPLV